MSIRRTSRDSEHISRLASDVVHGNMSKRNSLLRKEDVLVTGIGAFLTLVPFGLSLWDFTAACYLIFIGLLSGITPDVFDIETQYSLYLSKHTNRMHYLLYLLCIFPQFYSLMLLIACHSHWLGVGVALYCFYYIIADRTLAGFSAVLIIVALHELVSFQVKEEDDSWFYFGLVTHVTCWGIQIFGHLYLEAMPSTFVQTINSSFLHIVLMAPLLVMNDLYIYLGFNKGLARKSKSMASNILIGRKMRSLSE